MGIHTTCYNEADVTVTVTVTVVTKVAKEYQGAWH